MTTICWWNLENVSIPRPIEAALIPAEFMPPSGMSPLPAATAAVKLAQRALAAGERLEPLPRIKVKGVSILRWAFGVWKKPGDKASFVQKGVWGRAADDTHVSEGVYPKMLDKLYAEHRTSVDTNHWATALPALVTEWCDGVHLRSNGGAYLVPTCRLDRLDRVALVVRALALGNGCWLDMADVNTGDARTVDGLRRALRSSMMSRLGALARDMEKKVWTQERVKERHRQALLAIRTTLNCHAAALGRIAEVEEALQKTEQKFHGFQMPFEHTCSVDGAGEFICGECSACATRDCEHGEPLHYHHDGCPSCIENDALPYTEE